MIGVPVAERLPLTSRTFEALARWAVAACASAPGSVIADERKLPFSSRTSPRRRAALTSVWCGAAAAVVVDVSGSSRWRRSS